MEFKTLFISSMLIAIIVICMIGFIYNFSSNNDAEVNILTDPVFSGLNKSLIGSMENASEDAALQKKSFQQDNGILTVVDFVFTSIINSGKIFSNTVTLIYDLTFGVVGRWLGISPDVLAGFTAIAVVVIILSLWGLYKIGK